MNNTSQRFQFLRSGKVRDVYVAADRNFLLIVASDRISAFDHVLPNIIPKKGQILRKSCQTIGLK